MNLVNVHKKTNWKLAEVSPNITWKLKREMCTSFEDIMGNLRHRLLKCSFYYIVCKNTLRFKQ